MSQTTYNFANSPSVRLPPPLSVSPASCNVHSCLVVVVELRVEGGRLDARLGHLSLKRHRKLRIVRSDRRERLDERSIGAALLDEGQLKLERLASTALPLLLLLMGSSAPPRRRYW